MTAFSSSGSHSNARSELLPAFARRNTTPSPAPHVFSAEESKEVELSDAEQGTETEGDEDDDEEEEQSDEEAVFPCEFCKALKNASELDSHQRVCREDKAVSAEGSAAEVQLPCEFCNEPYAASELAKHQSQCQHRAHVAIPPAHCDDHAALPCEFCGESVLGLEIAEHQRVCQEQLAVQDEALANALREDTNDTDVDSVDSDSELEGGDQESTSSEAWLEPCKFCGQEVEVSELIITHAPACEKQQLAFAQGLQEDEPSDKEDNSTDEQYRPPKIRRRHVALGGKKVPLEQPHRAHDTDANAASSSAAVTHLRQRLDVRPVRTTSLVRALPAASELKLPFFQVFENVKSAGKSVWETMTRFLGQLPEFIDSKEHTACMRKRGWIHNLPTKGRPPLPDPSDITILAVLPKLATNWPQWDTRTKFNCFVSDIGWGAKAQRINDEYENNGFKYVSKESMDKMRKLNMVWSEKHPHTLRLVKFTEMERVLGLPDNYTGTIAITKQRASALGSTFAVPTLARLLAPAAHLWRDALLFPEGICVLSLFDGIGAAAIALHTLGVKMRAYHTSEIDKDRERVVRNWFATQREKLGFTTLYIPHGAINEGMLATEDGIAQVLREHGPFDLVIGGSPCNNLSSANRHTRLGLDGEHSKLFYDYVHVVNSLRILASKYDLRSRACE